MNNEMQLIELAKNGDEQAFEELVAFYKPLVVSVSRKYFLMGGNHEDLLQEGMVGLFKAVKSYDKTKNSSFSAYAKMIVERQMINAIKSSLNQKHNPLNDYLALNNQGGIESEDDKLYFVLGSNDDSPEIKVIKNDNIKEIFSKIESVLSEFEMNVLEYYLEGLSYLVISEKLNTTTKSIDNALNRIKKKLLFLKP